MSKGMLQSIRSTAAEHPVVQPSRWLLWGDEALVTRSKAAVLPVAQQLGVSHGVGNASYLSAAGCRGPVNSFAGQQRACSGVRVRRRGSGVVARWGMARPCCGRQRPRVRPQVIVRSRKILARLYRRLVSQMRIVMICLHCHGPASQACRITQSTTCCGGVMPLVEGVAR